MSSKENTQKSESVLLSFSPLPFVSRPGTSHVSYERIAVVRAQWQSRWYQLQQWALVCRADLLLSWI